MRLFAPIAGALLTLAGGTATAQTIYANPGYANPYGLQTQTPTLNTQPCGVHGYPPCIEQVPPQIEQQRHSHSHNQGAAEGPRPEKPPYGAGYYGSSYGGVRP